MFDKKEYYVHYIFISLNWIFGLLFLWAGFFDTKAGGILIILISLLLLPPVRAVVFSLTHKEIPMWARSLSISSLLVIFLMVNNQKQEPLLLETQLTVPANSISQHHENTNVFANKPISIQIKPEKKETLPEKAVQIQSPNTKQANQSRNNKRDSEIKINEILAKLKNIPTSQFELNRNLYQQLVSFNPSENKYKKKLSFYSEKIKQSRNTVKKNINQTCENIRTTENIDYSPNWLSENGHCLSENEKKKMEIALFKKVKKIPSKNITQNWEGYKLLSILNPNKKSYLDKLKHYENKLKVRTANL